MRDTLRGYVYKTTNTVNGKSYVGLHSGAYNPSYLGSGVMLQRAIRKYGKSRFSVKVLALASTVTELNELEKEAIATERRRHGADKLYNLADGGFQKGLQGTHLPEDVKRRLSVFRTGFRHTDETRKKISTALMGHRLSDATKEKLSIAGSRPRKPHTEETKNKIRLANLGVRRPHTEEAKRKISRTLKARWLAMKDGAEAHDIKVLTPLTRVSGGR